MKAPGKRPMWAAAMAISCALGAVAQADLVSRWALDGDLDDSGGGADNFGIFAGGDEPAFVGGFDGTEEGAIALDGIDDYVEVFQDTGLPISHRPAYSVALWVKGFPQPDRRVFSEASRSANAPLFTIGTDNTGATGAVDIYIRTEENVVLVPHIRSAREAFDGAWHHIAWIDDGGRAALYIDGVRDAADFRYGKRDLPLDTTTIGGILRARPSHFFAGTIDDVRVYDHALTPEEVLALVPEPEGCPGGGDTHAGDLEVEGPAGRGPGTYTVTAVGASDDSGDPILYTFTAASAEGDYLQAGPQEGDSAAFALYGGTWTIAVRVDDDLLCRDEATDAARSVEILVVGPEPALIAHFPFDGDVEDAAGMGNDGTYFGGIAPTFVEGFDLAPGGAIALDGADDYVEVLQDEGLPLYENRAFTVAMWVQGLPQPDRRVFSESSRTSNEPLYNLGTDNTGATGRVDVYIRDDAGRAVVSHWHSTGIAFDGTWHHIAWVDDGGRTTLYIDGEPDPASPVYVRPGLTLDATTIGGILRARPSHFFAGRIDDVRLYNHALGEDEVLGLLESPPPVATFRRGDVNADGSITIGDAVWALNFLFAGGPAPPCPDAADIDDDGRPTIGDAIALLDYEFAGGRAPADPGPSVCGPDPSEDDPWPPETCTFRPCE